MMAFPGSSTSSSSSSLLVNIPLSAQKLNRTPVTAMITIDLPQPTSASSLTPSSSSPPAQSSTWTRILQLFHSQSTVTRLYWGTHREQPTKIQLHIVRATLAAHEVFLNSPVYSEFRRLVRKLASHSRSSSSPSPSPTKKDINGSKSPKITIRHAYLHDMTESSLALTTAPFTGTAIYLPITNVPQWDAAWALWSTIVPGWPGCLGVSGGYLIDEYQDDGDDDQISSNHHHKNNDTDNNNDIRKNTNFKEGQAYIAWVGWQSVETHDALHHDKFFRDRRIILTMGNCGYKEYGHVVWYQEPKVAAKASL